MPLPLHSCIHRGAAGLHPLAATSLLPDLELSGADSLHHLGDTPLSPQDITGWRLSPLLMSDWKLLLVKLRKPIPSLSPLPRAPLSQCFSCFPGSIAQATSLKTGMVPVVSAPCQHRKCPKHCPLPFTSVQEDCQGVHLLPKMALSGS